MNTDKILAEAIAKDYVPKDNFKVVALKKLDKKAKYACQIVELAREISYCIKTHLGDTLSLMYFL